MVDLDDPTEEPAESRAPTTTYAALRVVYSGARVLLRDHRLQPRTITEVGRGAPSLGGPDLRLDTDGRLSRQHARFTVVDGRIRLENKSDKGSHRNGNRVDGVVELEDGDVVRMGDTFLVVRTFPEDARDAPMQTVLGRAPSVQQLRSLIDVVGPTQASVMILGETGTGKDVVARALHERSRRGGPFIAVNCAAIPENLAESQLFGHKQGSFTGATKDHTGFFRDAHKGTLFLDELGELPLALQPKLLRVLDERSVQAVGATTGTPVDVRVVVATNREIAKDVERGAFRADLFARLAEITMSLPPLRTRKEDVLLLLQSALPALRTDEQALSPQLVNALLLHAWPFNVRELLKVASELSVKAQGRKLLDVDLLEGRVLGPMTLMSPPSTPPPLATKRAPSLKDEVPAPSREELERLLTDSGGKVSDIARATGRSRTQVYRWLEQAGLEVERYRR